jgi:cytochrome c556
MAGTSKKRSAVLCDDKVGEYLLLSESEESAFLDAVVNDGSDEDDSATKDILWETMQNCKGQRENFTGNVGHKVLQNMLQKLWTFLNCFTVKTNRHSCQRNRYAGMNCQSVQCPI